MPDQLLSDMSVEGLLHLVLDHRSCRTSPASLKSLDANSVHDYRVSLRTLRSQVKNFESMLRVLPTRLLAAQLKLWDDMIAPIRNVDVMQSLLLRSTSIPQSDAVRECTDQLSQYRIESCQNVKTQDHQRADEVVALVNIFIDKPPLRGSVPRNLQQFTSRLMSMNSAQGTALMAQTKRALESGKISELHKLRIRAKRFRYQCEAIEIIGLEPNTVHYDSARAIQNHVGLLQDMKMLSDWVAKEGWPGTLALAKPLKSDVQSQRNLSLQAIRELERSYRL